MEIVKVRYLDKLSCSAIHLDSSTEISTSAPKDNNGDGSSFSPTDLLCTALATCCITIMGIAASKREISMKNVSCTVEKVMASAPRRVSKIVLNFKIAEAWSENERKLMEQAARSCPVMLSLHPDTEKELVFNYE
ncbi:MAG: OsmC family protein [Luteibaculum sp.]